MVVIELSPVLHLSSKAAAIIEVQYFMIHVQKLINYSGPASDQTSQMWQEFLYDNNIIIQMI